jgi:hypothetical protein
MTVRDWLQLLIVPFALVVISLVFTAQQDQRQQQIEQQRAEAEREIAEHRAQDEALQAHLDQMSGLLLEKDLRSSDEESEVRTLARARTLTVLGRLDPSRKTAVMQFLDEAELIQGADDRASIISLTEADLTKADLYAADLRGANLTKADLTDADLTGANVTQDQLDQAKALEGATMPDGPINAGRYATKKFEPALSVKVSDGWQLAPPEMTNELLIEGPDGGHLLFISPLHVFDPSNPSERKEVPAPENADE